MRSIRKVILILLLSAVTVGSAAADIYMWTDSSGTKHITNFAPPPHAELIVRTPEIPYDAEADRRRQESDRQQQLARQQLALAEQEALLLEREREANARIAEAGQLAREALAHQKQLASEARDDDYSYRSYWYVPYRSYHRSYYRENGNIYYHRPDRVRHADRGNPGVTHRLGPGRGTGSGPGTHQYVGTAQRVPRPSGRSPHDLDYGSHAKRRR